jgi:hypothetical protein
MIEIGYKENLTAADLDGCTIAEAREQFKEDLGIPHKTFAVLNGKTVRRDDEINVVLNDEDRLHFQKAGLNKSAVMVGALILAMVISGSVFAFGYINASTSLNVTTVNADFATVSANTSHTPSWTVMGMAKMATGNGTLFDISTNASGYTGDFVATVSMVNVDQLVKIYRNLTLTIEVRDGANNLIDINEDNVVDSHDFTLITLENAQALLNIKQAAPGVYTVLLKSGYFISNVHTSAWTAQMAEPQFFCEVAQR